MHTLKRKLLTAALVVAGAASGIVASAQAAEATTYPCQNNSVSQHTKKGTAVIQDGRVWRSAGYTVALSGGVSNRRGSDCVAATDITAKYGVTGQYLTNAGFGWTIRAQYLHPVDKKFYNLGRVSSWSERPWNWYYDNSKVVLYGQKVTQLRVTFTANHNGRFAGSTTLTCNVLKNTCS